MEEEKKRLEEKLKMYQQSQASKDEVVYPTYWQDITQQTDNSKLYDVDANSDEFLSVTERYYSFP